MRYWNWDGGWHMPFFGLGPLAFIVIIGGAIYYFSRRRSPFGGGPSSDGARDILDRRYASGEIAKDQYEQMKRDLQG